jgi:hypothetical protein
MIVLYSCTYFSLGLQNLTLLLPKISKSIKIVIQIKMFFFLLLLLFFFMFTFDVLRCDIFFVVVVGIRHCLACDPLTKIMPVSLSRLKYFDELGILCVYYCVWCVKTHHFQTKLKLIP